MFGSGGLEVPPWLLGAFAISHVATCGIALWACRSRRRAWKAAAVAEGLVGVAPHHEARAASARLSALGSPGSDGSACFYEPEAEADLEAGAHAEGAVGRVRRPRDLVLEHCKEPRGLETASTGTPRFGRFDFAEDSDDDLCLGPVGDECGGLDELFGHAAASPPEAPAKPALAAAAPGGAIDAGTPPPAAPALPLARAAEAECGPEEVTTPTDIVVDVTSDGEDLAIDGGGSEGDFGSESSSESSSDDEGDGRPQSAGSGRLRGSRADGVAAGEDVAGANSAGGVSDEAGAGAKDVDYLLKYLSIVDQIQRQHLHKIEQVQTI